MTEKIERMELDFESRDKQLMELQELYNSQQLLTAELGDKLEKTEKNLHETEHALFDLEERHRQANATIKEKEYLISKLLKSEKALVERALELREQLENAASDVVVVVVTKSLLNCLRVLHFKFVSNLYLYSLSLPYY